MAIPEPRARRLTVRDPSDPQYCSVEARALALALGFPPPRATALAIAVAELASNIVRHAGEGTIDLRPLAAPDGLEVVAADRGPGISDVALAQQDGFSRGRFNSVALERGEGLPPSLGCGLGAVRRLADECEIDSEPGRGTTVTARLWRQGRPR
ncbi:MAG TPA: ATP-binding protein [Myxococcales bacterium]|jgi:serine/threonine-protein kinase RsbT